MADGSDERRGARTGNRQGRRQDAQADVSGRALIGIGLGLAAAGAAAFFVAKSREDDTGEGSLLSDAPDHVLRGKARKTARNSEAGAALVGRTVTINKPRQDLYEVWRDFTRFPDFMDNVREVRKLDDKVSEWTIAAPAGASVTLKTRIIEDEPGTTIAWASEPDSPIETAGRVEFADAPPGRGTYVRLVMRYTPPVGTLGRLAAKLLQREPNVQARRDLNRFKSLMETGEVATNASPSGRKSETPTEARI
ncbi:MULTISPECIES: SRPBCC family protein [Sphingomonas]|uniref:SRPBCC family protein n=1 Tax=Sphingomonas TaxID=13687 RepID=UPI000DEF4055|nr:MULTISPECIES: SRPBCC family protein [Sphingomonas]